MSVRKHTENALIRYSRAGDEFHYRWAARRCLKLIYPKSTLAYIVVEGSGPEETELDGEYVMDVTEYSNSAENNSKKIAYYQLKHTTVKKDTPFNLSDLRDTIEGFAARYSEHLCEDNLLDNSSKVTFSIVTNRPISDGFKKNFSIIGNGGRILRQDGKDHQFQKTVEEYTQLKGEHLQAFCASIEFADSEGDYNVQREELRRELALILAGTVDDPEITNIVELVRAKVMPDSDGRIVREDVFMRFGVTSERDLFPAPPGFEDLDNVIKREQHKDLLNKILEESSPMVIHASGGVGKSIVALQLANSLPVGSLGIVYDCFGGGKYRNRSETRHRHRDALIQIINELASYGLCAPLIAGSSTEDQIMRKFLTGIHSAVSILRQADETAILAIFVDAADNAEMAAAEFSQSCFVHELLREQIPEGCRLIALCRTERIHLLQPSDAVLQVPLEPFSKDETLDLLKQYIPTATEDDALEFHRLTNGNPRVQANALSGKESDIAQILTSLGPSGMTIEDQIEAQLNSAIAAVKDQFPVDYQSHIDAICVGLAILPPFIPLTVLADAADVNEAAVKSFVSDLGRPLWLSDTSVQFRDEPTETWFREKFSATTQQITTYVTRIESLSQTYSYVAEALPSLLLQAEKYEDLVELALSDELLPNNPIDGRNVRVYRLQFAFKAALKLRRFADAIKLALRAGEEVAGNKRQLEILQRNVDLIAPLQSGQRVQEIAFRRLLRGEWDGSENVYSAALLSSVDDFKGEARGYLRAANNWLRLYFEERDKIQDKHNRQDRLRDEDLVELLFAHYNLFGVEQAVDFLFSWRPPEIVYRLASPFVRKLIDTGKFDAIDEISQLGSRNQYLMIAITKELQEVGRFPSADSMRDCLVLMTTKRTRIANPNYSYGDTTPSAILSFAEACAVKGLPKRQILRLLRHYFPQRASRSVSSRFQETIRNAYLRAVALKSVLSDNSEPNLDELLPEDWVENKQRYNDEQNIREFKEVVGGMLPWHFLRARLLINDIEDVFEAINTARQRSIKVRGNGWRDSDTLPYEISQILIEILALYHSADSAQVDRFFTEHLKENRQVWIQDRLKAVRIAFRSDRLVGIRQELEHSAYDVVKSATNEGPETRAEWHIELARAVLPINPNDAAAYFDYAIESVSKFGDEIVERWEAVAAIANRTAEGGHVSPEMAYRFIRCAELIGDNVAREKYFNRDEAIEICVRLSPPSAFAALSRWRDRDIGWFYRQLPALAFEVVHSNAISSKVGWSLSAFFDGYGLDDFAALCISHEGSVTRRQIILDMVIRDLRLGEATESSWKRLGKVVQKYNIKSEELEYILHFYANKPEAEGEEINPPRRHANYSEELGKIDWGELFNGLELSTSSGLSSAIERFKKASTRYYDHDTFWQEVYNQIEEKDVVAFLEALVDAEKVNKYDISHAISQIPGTWRNKVSVRRYWDEFLRSIAQRFASSFTNHYIRRDYFKEFGLPESKTSIIHEGVLAGLSSFDELADASAFFGFVEMGITYIMPKEAYELLDYALARFEMHLDAEYADGNWADWLAPPSNISVAFAGFIWAALGSPRSEIRWRAAHCVRRLAETNCVSEIDALIGWMARDEVGAFGSCKFPFYNLHARQYLLIALARVSIDHPYILKQYHHLFVHHALENMAHVLIQKFAAQIAHNIEKAFPNTYGPDVIERLHKIGVSQLPVRQTERSYENNFNSPWHDRGEVNSDLEFFHGWDFDRYWFEPLGRVFGIPRKQVEELATEVVVNEWQVNNDGSYGTDPRAYIWRSGQTERETWHDHGSYPRSDNLSFYLSYHSMFVVAARLLQQMPVVHSRDWSEDAWKDWLQRYMLTRVDGYWLSDRRDLAPLVPRTWFYQKKSKNWRWEITPSDFLDGLLIERNGETWLNVYGWWDDSDGERDEGFHISTALVSPKASQSLLNALITCPPNDFKLPEYEEDRMEFDIHPFELKGWIWREDSYVGLDEFDPHAGTLPYPPYHIGEAIVDKLQLTVGADLREWHLPDTDRASIICELWGTNKVRQDEDPLRQGRRLSASLAFLKKLCTVFDCELIFEVQIERRFRQRSYLSNKDGNEYAPPYHKIYLFSADGKLRDTRTHFQLR